MTEPLRERLFWMRTLKIKTFSQGSSFVLLEMRDHYTFLRNYQPTPPPPQTNINTYFSLREKCWLRGGIGGQFPSKMTSLPGRLSKEIKPAGDLFTARAKEWMKKARERKKGKSFWRESMHKSLNVLRIKSNVYF